MRQSIWFERRGDKANTTSKRFLKAFEKDIREGCAGKKLFVEWMKENDAAVIEDFRNKQKALTYP